MATSLTGEFQWNRPRAMEREGPQASPSTGLSLNVKLPLFAAGLVLFVGLALATAATLEMRRTSFAVANARLLNVTNEFDDLFRQSAVQAKAQVAVLAANKAVIAYARNPSQAARGEAIGQLIVKGPNTQTLLGAELRDNSGHVLLSALPTPYAKRPLALSAPRAIGPRDSARIGGFQAAGDTILYPVVADVRGVPGVSVVQWRLLSTQSKARDQLQQLIGSGARLYLANQNGSLWTDLQRSVAPLAVTASRPPRIQLVAEPGNERDLVTAVPILGSPWMFAIAFPEKGVLEPLKLFALRLSVITLAAMLLAFGAAWYGSRRITVPLAQLTAAACRIADGQPHEATRVARRDELGQLSQAFNEMGDQIQSAERDLRRMNDELEARVRHRTRELENANREMETFSYSVSHDLRTPLRALDGFSQALIEDYGQKLDETGIGYLNRIRRGSQRMGDLIDAMLQLSRVSRGEMRRQPVNLSELAQDAIETQRLGHPYRQVDIRIEPGLEVNGDPALLRTMLGNLLANAWKFTARTPEARIEFGATHDPARGRVFVVRDNGIGFDMAYADKLFGAFQRLHSQSEFDGTGVGLATAQRIVHRHGGEIWADARPNAGAAFSFTLN